MAVSYPVSKSWTVEVTYRSSGITEDISYIDIDFTKTHPSEYPDTFTITIAGTQTGYTHFDAITIKKFGTTKFYGYIEKILWTSEANTIISGRCRKFIVWKKFTERFIESRSDLAGFFGYVDGAELFKFFLRCPVSDFPTEDEETWDEYPRHKVGWGISPRLWDVSASSTASGTHPTYAILRLLDFYWRNRGTDSQAATLMPDGGSTGDWTDAGGCSDEGCVDDCSNDADYIESATNGQVAGPFTFDDLAATATGINSVKLRLRLRRTTGWWGNVTVKAEVYDGSDWFLVGYASFSYVMGWAYATFHGVGYYLDTPAKVNAAQVRITRYSGVEMGVRVRCSCMELLVDYSENGTQEAGDYFEIDFNERRNRVCAIYAQSRASPDQYPENYCVEKFIDAGLEDFTDGDWDDSQDPNNHITIASATHIDHHQFLDEDAYTYKDFGAGYFTDFIHRFKFKIEDPIPVDTVTDFGPVYIPYCLSNAVSDFYAMTTGGVDHIAVYIHSRSSAPTGPCFALRLQNGGSGTISYSANLAAGNVDWYCTVTKSGRKVLLEVTDENGNFILDANGDPLRVEGTVPTADISLRYMYAGVTCNTGAAVDCDGDIEYFNLGDWSEIVCETDHACQDILHSWAPIPMDKIRIRVTEADATRSWQISQIYVYESDLHEFCVVDDE